GEICVHPGGRAGAGQEEPRLETDDDIKAFSPLVIVMFHEASGKKKIKMATYLTSWSRKDQKKSAERTGPGLFKRYMRLILSRAPNARGKIVLLFLAEFPYLVLPLVPQRIQYSATMLRVYLTH
ncbi:MAG: hypothetical protein JRI42_04570, partial [Deltaproteobacteria bacterium]|nr:hypothetical protein [Deltaproteobacteria bacterium]